MKKLAILAVLAAFLAGHIGFDAIHRINADTIAAVLPQLGDAVQVSANAICGAGRVGHGMFTRVETPV